MQSGTPEAMVDPDTFPSSWRLVFSGPTSSNIGVLLLTSATELNSSTSTYLSIKCLDFIVQFSWWNHDQLSHNKIAHQALVTFVKIRKWYLQTRLWNPCGSASNIASWNHFHELRSGLNSSAVTDTPDNEIQSSKQLVWESPNKIPTKAKECWKSFSFYLYKLDSWRHSINNYLVEYKRNFKNLSSSHNHP